MSWLGLAHCCNTQFGLQSSVWILRFYLEVNYLSFFDLEVKYLIFVYFEVKCWTFLFLFNLSYFEVKYPHARE